VLQARHLALKVPSVLVPDNYNIILNPLHPLFAKVKVVAVSNVSFDQRLIKTH
jgi:RES domain-containing protein